MAEMPLAARSRIQPVVDVGIFRLDASGAEGAGQPRALSHRVLESVVGDMRGVFGGRDGRYVADRARRARAGLAFARPPTPDACELAEERWLATAGQARAEARELPGHEGLVGHDEHGGGRAAAR